EAFAELLRRHGPMVHAICSRVLGGDDGADDAFQATFLVLVRRADAVRRGAPLANWLSGVAWKTARQALRRRTRLARRERLGERLPDVPAPEPPPANDWRPHFDAALQRLPERFRAPVVLCDLQEASRGEAALQLGVAEGTLSSRLARGRQRLRQ